MEDRYILAFETSCDETSVAVLKNETELLSNVIASQIESHKRFGGVVPEVASRHHVEVITVCIEEALAEAGISWIGGCQVLCLGSWDSADSSQSHGGTFDGSPT